MKKPWKTFEETIRRSVNKFITAQLVTDDDDDYEECVFVLVCKHINK